MKIRASLSLILLAVGFFCLMSVSHAQTTLAEKIKSVSQNLLEGYTQPIVTAFGTGISTGLFHSAASHKLLGFDIGVRAMWIKIPDMAKLFNNAEVIRCWLDTNDEVVYDTLFLDSVSTIVGPENQTDIPALGDTVGIPPFIPGGFDVSGVPLVMPQVNVGLLFGTEAAIRYVPYTYQDTRIHFLGVGLKQNLNALPFMKTVPLPVDVALGGAMQWFYLMDGSSSIVSSQTWNLQLLASKNLIVFEPFVGVGLEGTKIFFHYNFDYEIPAPGGGFISQTDTINVTISAQNEHRAMAGFTFKLGIFYLHYDYNFLQEYATHNGIIGFTIR